MMATLCGGIKKETSTKNSMMASKRNKASSLFVYVHMTCRNHLSKIKQHVSSHAPTHLLVLHITTYLTLVLQPYWICMSQAAYKSDQITVIKQSQYTLKTKNKTN